MYVWVCAWAPGDRVRKTTVQDPLQYRLGPADSSNVRGSCCGLSLEREAGRKGPAHQVFVNGLPEECPSWLLASHPAVSTKPTLRQEPMCRVRSTQAHLQTTQITQVLCTGIHLHMHKGSHAHTCTKYMQGLFIQTKGCMCTHTQGPLNKYFVYIDHPCTHVHARVHTTHTHAYMHARARAHTQSGIFRMALGNLCLRRQRGRS